jgi:hypothetical protein
MIAATVGLVDLPVLREDIRAVKFETKDFVYLLQISIALKAPTSKGAVHGSAALDRTSPE